MSAEHGHDAHGGHGGGNGGSNVAGACAFGYCDEVAGAAKGMANMIHQTFLGIFGGGESGGGHHDAGH